MRMPTPGLFSTIACVSAGMIILACGSPGPVGDQGAHGAGAAGSSGIVLTNAGGASGKGNGSGSPGGAYGTAGNCGSTTVRTNKAPADMLIVLDRSLSMTYSTEADCTCGRSTGGLQGQPCSNTTTCTDRWTAVKSAVAATVSADSSINWGLELFAAPSGGGNANCGVASAPQVPIAANSAATIQSQVNAATPGSYTPTADALEKATAYLKTVNDGNSKAILLATDGMPNCPKSGSSTTDDLPGAEAAATAAAAAGFPVYVVGIGPQASISNLNKLASDGGTGNYYPATSPEQLTTALGQIAKIVASCTFTPTQPPSDPSLVYVYVDKNLIQQNASNGWTFGAGNKTVELHGSYCDNFLSGKASQVEIVFGCPGVPPDQIIP
jgi:hypothetical protein